MGEQAEASKARKEKKKREKALAIKKATESSDDEPLDSGQSDSKPMQKTPTESQGENNDLAPKGEKELDATTSERAAIIKRTKANKFLRSCYQPLFRKGQRGKTIKTLEMG